VASRERERCAAVANRRAEMWETRARLNEALALADALRVSIATPPEA
jgi:pyruvate-formate lyase